MANPFDLKFNNPDWKKQKETNIVSIKEKVAAIESVTETTKQEIKDLKTHIENYLTSTIERNLLDDKTLAGKLENLGKNFSGKSFATLMTEMCSKCVLDQKTTFSWEYNKNYTEHALGEYVALLQLFLKNQGFYKVGQGEGQIDGIIAQKRASDKDRTGDGGRMLFDALHNYIKVNETKETTTNVTLSNSSWDARAKDQLSAQVDGNGYLTYNNKKLTYVDNDDMATIDMANWQRYSIVRKWSQGSYTFDIVQTESRSYVKNPDNLPNLTNAQVYVKYENGNPKYFIGTTGEITFDDSGFFDWKIQINNTEVSVIIQKKSDDEFVFLKSREANKKNNQEDDNKITNKTTTNTTDSNIDNKKKYSVDTKNQIIKPKIGVTEITSDGEAEKKIVVQPTATEKIVKKVTIGTDKIPQIDNSKLEQYRDPVSWDWDANTYSYTENGTTYLIKLNESAWKPTVTEAPKVEAKAPEAIPAKIRAKLEKWQKVLNDILKFKTENPQYFDNSKNTEKELKKKQNDIKKLLKWKLNDVKEYLTILNWIDKKWQDNRTKYNQEFATNYAGQKKEDWISAIQSEIEAVAKQAGIYFQSESQNYRPIKTTKNAYIPKNNANIQELNPNLGGKSESKTTPTGQPEKQQKPTSQSNNNKNFKDSGILDNQNQLTID